MSDRAVVTVRGGFLARLNIFETLILAAICLVAIAGVMLVGKGFYIKVMDEQPGPPLEFTSP